MPFLNKNDEDTSPATRRLALFPKTAQIQSTPSGERLTIAGCDLYDLAERYGTPLYLYDEATLDAQLTEYRDALAETYPAQSGVTYAGKAFLCTAMAGWTARERLWVDCTGAGEMKIAAAGGVLKANIVVHGVNKSFEDLNMAVESAGVIVVDNLSELQHVSGIMKKHRAPTQRIWLRFRPGWAVQTHAFIQTGQVDSKFGMDRDEIVEATHYCRANELPLSGLHFHLGSMFTDHEPVKIAIEQTLKLAVEIEIGEDWTFCPGGGLGAAYHENDLPAPSIHNYVRAVAESVQEGCKRGGIPLPRLQLEPGRSLVARAGVALYRVGAIKMTPNRRWILVDGGLADNPRPALYGSRYSALPVQDPNRPTVGPAWLAGPYCESSDVLVEALQLPKIEANELIAIPASGAYQLSMSNNYNGARRPAVLWLDQGGAHLIQKRQSLNDLIQLDNL